MVAKLPPVPIQVPVADRRGSAGGPWVSFFQALFDRVGGATGSAGVWSAAKAAAGYQKLPSGLIVAWGETTSLGSGTTTAIVLPSAFPTACLQAFAGVRGNSASSTSATGHHGTGNYSAAGFDLYNRTSLSLAFNWLAVGH